MHAGWLGGVAVVVVLVVGIDCPPAGAQNATLDQRLAMVRTAAAGTREGQGLPTALAETRVAVGEARRAAAATDLATQQAHARGVSMFSHEGYGPAWGHFWTPFPDGT